MRYGAKTEETTSPSAAAAAVRHPLMCHSDHTDAANAIRLHDFSDR